MGASVLLMFVLALVLVNSGLADPEVGGDLKTGKKGNVLDVANSASSGDGKKAVIPGGDGLKEGAKSNDGLVSSGGVNGVDDSKKKTNDPGVKEKTKTEIDDKQLGSKGTGIEQTKTDDKGANNKSDLETKGKDKGSKRTGSQGSDGASAELKKTNDKISDEKITNDKGAENSGLNKEKAGGVSNMDSKDGTLVQERKEGLEACDSSSNSCSIEDKNVVACLRVPGNESPDLSLLVQNKGKEPVAVTISAPNFVKLERKQIKVKENDNEKVKVSIGNGESDGQIVLKAGNGKCILNFKGAVTHSSRKIPSYYMSLLRKPSYLWFVPLAVVLIIASVWIGISFRRKYVARNSPKYQKLEMELPVSGVSKTLADSHNEQDDWDDNWDDNWDDEEVGMPATMPVTPSFSPSGMASRRAIKDAWKD